MESRLRTFVRYATATTTIGALLVLTLAALVGSLGLLLLGALLVADAVAFLWAHQQLNRGNVQRAAVAICVGSWAVAVFLALFVDVPVLDFPVLLVLSVIVAVPYASQRVVLRLMAGAILLALVLTPLAFLVQRSALMPFSLRGEHIPGWLFNAIIIVVVPTIVGLILLLVWQYAAHLQDQVRELRESRSRIVTVQEGVRRDIAAYLHGRVQSKLLVLRSRLSGATYVDLVEHLDSIIQHDLCGVSRRLYPSILRRGLVAALQSLADHFEASVAVTVETDAELMRRERLNRDLLSEEIRLAGYRIAEEAMANVVKHAHATRVILRMELLGDTWLRLSVEDDGRGFEVGTSSAGLGLTALQDYAGAAGGVCIINSTPGAGAWVMALLPLSGARSVASRAISSSSPTHRASPEWSAAESGRPQAS